ncbi:Zinc resistance conferring protein [Paecilomyces lecythidis]|uniref:Zinc resistance conferring protein n=1 Tax=Paecilomyces lecythidis TaxID=3004212 RepID=A0ABR3XVM8_9EURO
MYTYGWQRAETLGALVNGVFLVALCMSIFLEAIQRLVEPQEVKNPKLVCIVGCFGLASNILGLVLFHDHSHGHGGHDHGHDHGHDEDAAEQGFVDHDHESSYVGDENGTVASILPENVVEASSGAPDHRARGFTKSDETDDTATDAMSPFSRKRRGLESNSRNSRRFSASSRGWGGVDSIHIHPATLRQDIIKASRFEDEVTSDSDLDNPDSTDGKAPNERSGLLRHKDRASNYTDEDATPTRARPRATTEEDIHSSHNHAQPKKEEKGKGGHGHDLNMRGVFLHVMGDALGNIGVIASALIIWLTDYSWRFYVDPGISLVITVIILGSAIPLCKAASRILLQAVPQGMSIDHIKEDIEQLPGVVGSHHLHVWQLSDTKLVASLHIQVDCEIKGEGSERYMRLARQVRKCLHAYGIHSSTIQPEFAPESDVEDNNAAASGQPGGDESGASSKAPSTRGDEAGCLLGCGDECARGGQCCPK